MKTMIDFMLLVPSMDYEITVSFPENMTIKEVADMLSPLMQRAVVSNVTVRKPSDHSEPAEERDDLDACIEIVMDTTNPGTGLTIQDARRIIRNLRLNGDDVPDMLTPEVFLDLYNTLEESDEEEEE